MTILTWNVRGINKKGRKQDVIDHIKLLSPSIVALVETKVKSSKIGRLAGCVPRHWLSCHNFEQSSEGRIWISWHTDIWTCTVTSVSIQQITLCVKNKGGLEGYLSVVYGLNTHDERLHLWKELQVLNISHAPWFLTGDFNTARFTNEKVGGKPLSYQQLSSFNDFVNVCSLLDLKSVGAIKAWLVTKLLEDWIELSVTLNG